MITQELIRDLEQAVTPARVLRDEPLSGHCSFRVGGPADLFVKIQTEGELIRVLTLLRAAEVETFILGRGTNLLIGDGGYRGAVVTMCEESAADRAAGQNTAENAAATDGAEEQNAAEHAADAGSTDGQDATAGRAAAEKEKEDDLLLGEVRVTGTTVRAGAGASLHKAAVEAARASLTGLEFAAGIPGTIGGGIVMNAGVYGGEMRQVVREVSVLTKDGEVRTYTAEEMEFGYRTSRLKREPSVVLHTVMELAPGDRTEIEARMADLAQQRRSKQPLEYPSAGSTFKRPEGYFAGKLIEDAGLKGFRCGDAEVSTKHSGFVINRGGATAAQIRTLIEQVQQTVYDSAGVRLEREVIYLGEF